MNAQEINKGITPSRQDFLNNKIVVVDGLIGGGKGLLSPIVGSLPKVEILVHRPKIEQICSMSHLKQITVKGAEILIKSWLDEEIINLSITRDVNFRPSDVSSIFHDARPWRYLQRLFLKHGDTSVERVIEKQMIVNIMTHSNSAYALPIFKACSDRLVYVRLVRSPMTEYLLNHLARWSTRWGNDIRGSMILHQKGVKKNKILEDSVPFFMLNNEDQYLNASPLEKAVLMLNEWQSKGDLVIDDLKISSKATIIEVPYEKFVFNPHYYINKIAVELDTKVDKVTERTMKKHKVPRASLTDAPNNKYYSKMGWSPPKKYLSVLAEFEKTRNLYKDKISTMHMSLLDDITDEYIKRYDIK